MLFKNLTSLAILPLMMTATAAQAHPLRDLWETVTNVNSSGEVSPDERRAEKSKKIIKDMKRAGDLFLVERKNEEVEVPIDELSLADLANLDTTASGGVGSINPEDGQARVLKDVVVNQSGKFVSVRLSGLGAPAPTVRSVQTASASPVSSTTSSTPRVVRSLVNSTPPATVVFAQVAEIEFSDTSDTAGVMSSYAEPDVDVDSMASYAPEDTGSYDSGMDDTGSYDSGMDDTGSYDSGMDDTGSYDSGMDDTGSYDSGMEDTYVSEDTTDYGYAPEEFYDVAAEEYYGDPEEPLYEEPPPEEPPPEEPPPEE